MKIYHNFNNMQQQSNRTTKFTNANLPTTDARYTPNCLFHPQTTNVDLRNYIYQIPSLIYPHYPYSNFTCPAPTYLTPFSQPWADSRYGQPGLRPESTTSSNLYSSQNIRVNTRNTRDKPQSQVINLESDEEDKKSKNSLVPTDNNVNKQTQKPIQVIQVIQLDENSKQEKEIIPEHIISKEQEIQVKSIQFQNIIPVIKNLQKIQLSEIKKNSEVIEEIKTKLIRKDKKKQQKLSLKQERSSPHLEKKKKIIENAKNKPKPEKYSQKPDKKRIQKVQKLPVVQGKKKIQQGSTRQICKYMQSHGQIRHGKQFQSDIPVVRSLNNIDFNIWIQEKRKKLLKREVGVFTY